MKAFMLVPFLMFGAASLHPGAHLPFGKTVKDDFSRPVVIARQTEKTPVQAKVSSLEREFRISQAISASS